MKSTVLTVIGTRPEAIKLSPILMEISKSKHFKNKICVTRQHTDLLDPFLLNLGIRVDYQFENYENKGSLHHSAANILKQFAKIFEKSKPDLVIVQGDTTTAFASALAAFYSHIKVAHVEAGLRTGNIYSPWPEESHRCLIDQLSSYFFAPTLKAKNKLISDGIDSKKIWVVGNTSIDALRLKRNSSLKLTVDSKKRMIIVTVHRRENHGKPLKEICRALRFIAKNFSDVKILFFLHPNPLVCNPAVEMLSGIDNIDLMEPLDHSSFIKLLDESVFVITDSGGIQEEATFMGKPALVVRNTTEREEGIQKMTARLIGTRSDDIIACCKDLLENKKTLKDMSKIHFPYGKGYAAKRIVNILEKEFFKVAL
jgi:UDP-N-acetylglucosamine 2-epimerase (non-hydrolysing)